MEASFFVTPLSNSPMLLSPNAAVKVEERNRGKCGNDMTAVGGERETSVGRDRIIVLYTFAGPELKRVDLRRFSC